MSAYTTSSDLEPVLAESVVLNFTKRHHVVTPTMIQLALGMSKEAVRAALVSLKEKGLIEHPEARTQLYRAVEPRR